MRTLDISSASAPIAEQILYDQPWEGTAWNLANLYLLSLGADAIADEAPRLVGLSEETTCFVSPGYFG